MTDEDFWKLVFLMALHKGASPDEARDMADHAVNHANDRWVNEAWSG